jgi:hypothetical protein
MENQPCSANNHLKHYVYQITSSLKQLAGIEIVDFSKSTEEQAIQVFNAAYILLAHNASDDPVFNYGNKEALKLFEMTWEEFTSLHSKYSAEQDEREQRERFLAEVRKNGYADNYSGIRISKSGKRFEIKNVLLWNVFDEDNNRIGQAAMFKDYRYLYL